MRKNLICLLLSGALALGLAACAPSGDPPSAGQTPSPSVETEPPSQPVETVPPAETPSLSPEPPAPPLPANYDLPDREYQPWQTAYMEFLNALTCAEQGNLDAFFQHGPYFDLSEERPDDEAAYEGLAVDERGVFCLDAGEQLRMTLVMALGGESYSLYDVDRDGVPELFVKYGQAEAGCTTQCYTFRDGQIVCIGEFDGGHSSLYTDPDISAVLRNEGYRGYAKIYEYPMEGGKLTEERVLFTEEDVQEYTEVDEIVPGAQPIPYFYTRLGDWQRSYSTYLPESEYMVDSRPHPSAGKALLLPIADWYDGSAATGGSSETARAAILAALNGEAELFGASGDHFYGDVGWTSWEAYIQPGGAYPYNDVPFTVQTHTWQDMNGDGQEECVLQLMTEDEEQNTLTVVLSEQEGAVYAYGFGFLDLSFDTIGVGYPYQSELYTDGALQNQYGEVTTLSFWKGQCYEGPAQRDPSARPVKWMDGFPAG